MIEERHRVAIVGAGPGGLTLAKILQNKLKMLGNEYTKIDVYESEASRSVRGQGGTLDLRASTGQRALRLAGLYSKFRSLARPEGQDLKILSKDGICRFQQSSSFSFSNKPEIDRGQLRDLLLESLNDGTVHWNHTLTSLHESDDGIRMNFANGETTVADLVVGADGAWSKVRKFLEPNIAPAYSGISFLDFHLDTCTEGFSNLSRLVGRGTMFALAPGQALVAQQTSAGIRVYAAFRCREGWLQKVAGVDDARRFLRTQFSGWDPAVARLAHACTADFAARGIYALPVGFAWRPHPCVTLLGDAAHLMSPFAGEGVNLAMHDAALLARELLRAADVGPALRRYEQRQAVGARAAAAESAANLDVIFSDSAPAGFVAQMEQYSTLAGLMRVGARRVWNWLRRPTRGALA